MPWNFGEMLSGRLPSRPAVPPQAAAKAKHKSNDNSSWYFTSGNNSSSSGIRTPSRGKSGKSLISSALWAVARTPALVEAVERVEVNFGDDPFLSAVLRALRPADLNDPSSLRQVAEAADAFLQANQSKLSVYDEIQPMEAIRAILGICGDSNQVFKESVETTYRAHFQCQDLECRFKTNPVEVREENLRCTIPNVQLAIEVRASSNTRTDVCGKCMGKKATKRYALERAAPCFVVTWTALARGDRGHDALYVTTTSGESLRFTLAVVIATHNSKFVCMFSERNNYFRVEGHSVKLITKNEWQNVKPCLAIFTRQAFSSDHASARGTGLPPLTSDVGGKAGRKRGREENGSIHFRGGGGSESGSGRSRGPAAAEVISIDDDDSDAGDVTIPAGGDGSHGSDGDENPGDRANGSSGSGRVSDGEHDIGARRSGGKVVSGCSATVSDGESGRRKMRLSRREVLGVDDGDGGGGSGVDRMDVEGEEAQDADNPSTAGIARSAGRRPGVFASAPSSEATATATTERAGAELAPAGAAAATVARDMSAARDGTREDLSPFAGSGMTSARGNRRDEPCSLRQSTPPANGSAPDAWMRHGDDGNGRSSCGDSGMPPGNEPSPRGRRPRVGGTLERESQSGFKGLAAVEVNDSSMDGDGDGDDDVELVTNRQACVCREDERTGSSAAAAAVAPPPPSKLSRPRGDHERSSGWIKRKRPSDLLTPSPDAKMNNDRCVTTGMSSGGLPDSPSSAARSRELQIHDLVDDDDFAVAALLPPSPVPREETRHPSGIAMPFIGPAPPPPFIGPARPPSHQPKRSLPPRPQPHATSSPWFTRKAKPASDSQAQVRRIFLPAASAAANAAIHRTGGGTAKGLERQATMTSSWGKKGAVSSKTPASGGGGGRRRRGGDLDEDEEWKPSAKGAAVAGSGGTSNNNQSSGDCEKGGGGIGDRGDGGNGREGLRSRRTEKMTEDLTGVDDSLQEAGGVKKACFGRGWESRLSGGGMPDDVTLTTIRGINLQQDHFERIVDSDGWLTSQIIDIRVKQLQELHPQHLYFDSSFFGFLCPKIEKGGAFVVDYERVAGWTKRSRLPGGKSSLFDMQKLFIPINQGNIHWVLVVVDMGGGSASESASGSDAKMVVSFFDSFGRDGTAYVEAVQQYLVSELSSRDKTREGLFAPRPRPPANAPRQHNSSDCGVLMLHVMEQLSCGPVDVLGRLTQDEIMSLRLQLVAKIRE